ncbi:MAG: hypothetical protein HQL31_04320 [Planctomycetes bacterium]|nr:hypothetical protein [Planctomycetota bacterium]
MARNPDCDTLFDYLEASPTASHAVRSSLLLLETSGTTELREDRSWKQESLHGLHSVVRGDSSLLAFRWPSCSSPAELHFRIIVAHTDSPALKLKPGPASAVAGCSRWGLEVYGSPLFASWLDRDLGIAGRVSWQAGDRILTRLIRSDKVVRIPQLALHLNREVNEKGLLVDAQKHFPALMGGIQWGRQELAALLGEAAGLSGEEVARARFELFLFDLQKPSYCGLGDEFIASGRLDNLAMCHAATRALISAPEVENIVQVICLFDHEEIGSMTGQGAMSDFLIRNLSRYGAFRGLEGDDLSAALATQTVTTRPSPPF